MIRDDDGVGALADGAAGILGDMNALDNDRPLPDLPDPAEIVPGHHRLLERRAHVRVQHRSRVWKHHVRELHQTAVAQKRGQPERLRGKLPDVRDSGDLTPEQLLDPVSHVPFAHTGNRCVDRQHQRGIADLPRPLDRSGRHIPSTTEVDLIPRGSRRRFANVLELASGERRECVERAGSSGGARRLFLAARIEHSTAANRTQNYRKSDRNPQNGRPQVA